MENARCEPVPWNILATEPFLLHKTTIQNRSHLSAPQALATEKAGSPGGGRGQSQYKADLFSSLIPVQTSASPRFPLVTSVQLVLFPLSPNCFLNRLNMFPFERHVISYLSSQIHS